MVRTIFLDAGGVLVWPNWTRVSAALAAQGLAVDAAALARADAPARREIDEAELVAASTDQRRGWKYFNLVLTHAGIELSDATDAALDSLQEYHRVHNLWEHVPPFVVPTLASLRGDGYRLVVLSNANGTLRRAFGRLGLLRYFDALCDSAEEGVEKPDPRYFEIALTRSRSDPRTTVHVGDLYNVDVAGARAAGLSAVLVDEAGLYADADCARIGSIAELPAVIRT